MGRLACLLGVLVAASAIGCGGKRMVGGAAPATAAGAAPGTAAAAGGAPGAAPATVAAAAPETDPDPETDPETDPDPDPDPETETVTAPATAPKPVPAAARTGRRGAEPADLDQVLTRPASLVARRQQFARAVEALSAGLGKPISAERALEEMPCGGWSGPECSNLTVGLEIAKLSAPVVASFHRKRTADISLVLAEAISIHSVWHDAYGFIRRKTGAGPGYTYAGCLFSKCDPGHDRNGQIDGILYQVGRLLGVISGPACGPDCTLELPPEP